MLKYSKEELKELIKNGFDVKLISFELDIPQEVLEQIKSELKNESNSIKKETKKVEVTKSKTDFKSETNKPKSYTYNEIRDKEAHVKMQEMRERYKKLFSQTSKTALIVQKELSPEETEQINQSIKVIEDIVEEIKDYPKKEKRKEIRSKAFEVQGELKKIKNYGLTIEQAEKLNSLLDVDQLKKIGTNDINSTIDKILNNYRKKIARKLAEAVDYIQCQTVDLEQLIMLQKRLTSKNIKENHPFVGTVESKINSKIYKIRRQQVLEKIKNDIPSSIVGIINDLVNGEIDIEKANEIIEKEAHSRVESKANTQFTLTQKQEKRQILIQIDKAISNQSHRFHIIDPEKTIIQIYKLNGGSLQSATRTVVENLISEKRYEEATEICNKLSNKNTEKEFTSFMQILINTIRNAKISDIVIKAINTKEEIDDGKYYALIKTYIARKDIKLGAIYLGKNIEGNRNITLADIWPDAKNKGR